MDGSDVDGIKRDISLTVNNIFDSYEKVNYCLPTMEELRALFSDHAESYIGPMNKLSVEGITNLFDKQQSREQKIWQVANELEAEQRGLRSQQ
ncbi:hypothetical protein [uncultured Photobacterium sp.]|uniref:hypothetical protein n=1 Tax=uncultured Photobacterium sp. TaxID=173973 RepID=UPI00262BB09F|nr:hypothetical protein [uncultured Photobacterium sp.]